jgi:hypothetical protein
VTIFVELLVCPSTPLRMTKNENKIRANQFNP